MDQRAAVVLCLGNGRGARLRDQEAAKRRRSELRDVLRQIRPWPSRPNDHPAICYHSLMSMGQTWDPAIYARNARFVSDLGTPVVELLAPKPDERILDLGCGDGVLTKKLADIGCEIVAVDSSAAQVEAA